MWGSEKECERLSRVATNRVLAVLRTLVDGNSRTGAKTLEFGGTSRARDRRLARRQSKRGVRS